LLEELVFKDVVVGTQWGRFALSTVSLVVCGSTIAAQPPKVGVSACAAEADAARRLACYDAEVAQSTEGKPVTARVAAVSHRSNGAVVLTLENDQVWEQSDDGPDLAISVGDTVKINRGMLGSYWLADHSSVAIKVRRTK
jgi:hypothetical protein